MVNFIFDKDNPIEQRGFTITVADDDASGYVDIMRSLITLMVTQNAEFYNREDHYNVSELLLAMLPTTEQLKY